MDVLKHSALQPSLKLIDTLDLRDGTGASLPAGAEDLIRELAQELKASAFSGAMYVSFTLVSVQK